MFPSAGNPLPRFNLHDPCAQDPHNLIANGSMGPANHDTPYGTVADGWNPFVMNGAPPNFRWEDNEAIDPGGGQQIYSDNKFDAGIYQTAHNLQPGMVYMFRWGYSLAAKSYTGANVRVQTIGRQLGVDPSGGTDPHSSNVIWGPQLFDGKAAVNRPEMQLVFGAWSDKATFYLRAIATDDSAGENRVWIDAICMETRPDIPLSALPPAARQPAPPPPTPQPATPPQPVTSPAPPPPVAAQPPAPVVSPPPTSVQAPAPSVPTVTYTVQRGDTLWGIACKLGVTVGDLVEANDIANPSLIHAGMVLTVPGAAPAVLPSPVAPPVPPAPATPVAPVTPPTGSSPATYTVVAGDTLYGISRKLGVSVAALTAANAIADPSLIHPGQVLIVPA
ncbi:MAG: LysM peptidoglycan-binding domain-containing protein [Anaerolineae bacterium]